MTFIELGEKIKTNYFFVEIVSKGKLILRAKYDELKSDAKRRYNDYRVLYVDTTSEVGMESPITRTRDFRPLLVVGLLEE